MNKRVASLLTKITRDAQALEQLLQELESRKENPRFVKAQALFSEGWRLQNWGVALTDTMEETYLFFNGKEKGYWADGTNRNTEEAFGIMGLPNDAEGEEIVAFLSDLTDEE